MKEDGPKFNLNGETPQELDAIGKLIDAHNESKSEKIILSHEQTVTALAQKYSLFEKEKVDIYKRLDEIDVLLREADARPFDEKEIKVADSEAPEKSDLDAAIEYEKLYQESVSLETRLRKISKEQVTIDKEISQHGESGELLFIKLRNTFNKNFNQEILPREN